MRKWIKTQLFEKHRIHEHPQLEKFAKVLTREDLWHVNRHSISSATAIGLFCAFIPIPFQMLVALPIAILFRANVFLSLALVWITNPITITPIFYLCYQIGRTVVNDGRTVPDGQNIDGFSAQWFSEGLTTVGLPLLVGSLLVGSVLALLGYILVQVAWRIRIARYQNRRRSR